MRAAAFTDLGDVSGIDLVDVDDPDVGPGDALVRIDAATLNRRDLSTLQGMARLDEDDLPYVPASDVAGVVEEVGDEVEGVEPGDRVLPCPNRTCGTCRYCREGPENFCERFTIADGGLAEQTAVPADRLVSLPESVSVEQAAALPVAYMTAWRMMKVADVEPGELVFVPGATGGVGVAAVQLADTMGARSIGTSRSGEKLERLSEVGATHTIESDDPDEIQDEMREIGRPDVVIDHMGGDYTELGLKALRMDGRHVICGTTVSPSVELSLPGFFLGQKSFFGSSMGTQNDLETLVSLVAAGRLDPARYGSYGLDETVDAFEAMDDRSAFGKIVVHPNA